MVTNIFCSHVVIHSDCDEIISANAVKAARGLDRDGYRLRMRHFPFPIGSGERDRWLVHMTRAVDSVTEEGPVRSALLDYFRMAAEQMVNQPAG